MKTIFIALFLTLLASITSAETLKEYVDKCKSEVGFSKLPELHCIKDGFQFQQFDRTPIDDYVGYRRIADQVDYVFACRWASNSTNSTAAGVEAIVHNRSNGKTCFFSAKLTIVDESADETDPTEASSTMISPTASNAADYWDSPAHVNQHVRCVNCHVAGPYIMTKNIAPFMARFGLMNNGHDTMGNTPSRYNAIGSTFSQWNTIVRNHIGTLDSGDPLRNCANSCHVLGGKSTQERRRGVGDFELQNSPNDFFIQEAVTNGSMPPVQANSPYRWINLDTPNASGDHETLSRLKDNYPHFACDNPSGIEAHVVGSDHIISSVQLNSLLPNVLNTFNLKEGLLCKQSEQPAGTSCKEYAVTYQCGDRTWTPLASAKKLTSTGDNELRTSAFNYNLCAGKGEPIAMMAAYNLQYQPIFLKAPHDKLSKFDSKGLVCRNDDQIDGKCSNYVVRFSCP